MNPTCTICRGDYFPTQDTWRGPVCDECRTPCAECSDWLENSPEVVSKGKRYHATCFIEVWESAA